MTTIESFVRSSPRTVTRTQGVETIIRQGDKLNFESLSRTRARVAISNAQHNHRIDLAFRAGALSAIVEGIYLIFRFDGDELVFDQNSIGAAAGTNGGSTGTI